MARSQNSLPDLLEGLYQQKRLLIWSFSLKILFVTTHEFDYAQDQLFAGLFEVLGEGNIFCYPWKPQYFWPRRKWVYPKNQGLILPERGSVERLRKGLGARFRASHLASIDLVVVASCKPDCLEAYFKIAEHLPKSTPKVFIDGGDRPEIAGDLLRLGRQDLFEKTLAVPFRKIFKREKLVDITYAANVVAFPFGWNQSLFPNLMTTQGPPKKYQVTFWAVESDPVRTRALQILEEQFDCRDNGTHQGQKFRKYKRTGEFYLEELKASQIVLNFRGVGWDTLRYWEATALGCFMISQKPQIEIPDNFIDGKEIVFCQDDLSDLIDKCKFYLGRPELTETIGKAAQQKAKQAHSHQVRAKTLLRESGL